MTARGIPPAAYPVLVVCSLRVGWCRGRGGRGGGGSGGGGEEYHYPGPGQGEGAGVPLSWPWRGGTSTWLGCPSPLPVSSSGRGPGTRGWATTLLLPSPLQLGKDLGPEAGEGIWDQRLGYSPPPHPPVDWQTNWRYYLPASFGCTEQRFSQMKCTVMKVQTQINELKFVQLHFVKSVSKQDILYHNSVKKNCAYHAF